MLQNLYVKNLALIDEIEVEFKRGLNILTGETGAGKSIILGSVNLALGRRYTKDILRKGAQYGLVELTFWVENRHQIEKLETLDIFPEDGAVVLSRRLMDGRSTSKINGETVQIGMLKEVAGILIDIHGQHEHQSLLYKKNQLDILDAFAGEAIRQVQAEVRSAYKKYKDCKEELEHADTDEAGRMKEMAFLEFEIHEIQEAGLKDEEDRELEAEYRRMLNARKIVENINQAYTYMSGGDTDNAEALVSRVVRSISEVVKYDTKMEDIYSQVLEVDSLLSDFTRSLSDYMKSLEFSEEEFRETEERLNEINRLKVKYGNTIEDIRAYCEEKEERLRVLNDYEHYMEELKIKLDKQRGILEQYTKTLTKLRKEQSKVLAAAIRDGLKDLNFTEVQFEIAFEELSDYTSQGKDDVEFRVSMNTGEEVKPLAEVASGGELSRIMLAIKTVMADRDNIETLIFDEIDVGISGRTAQKVSEKMEVIGKQRQVICITHLAQIAAMADAHYAIEKTVEDGVTKTGIRLLDASEEIIELARILGGAKITETVMESAREMKELAKS